jgi:LysR family transcriptional regulator, low CO2-responsive transcriptional regulator
MSDLRGVTRKQLRALAATVEYGSVTGAAKALLVTPPAITTQLKILEACVGSPLFDRRIEAFAPSEAGQALLEAAQDIERLLARAGERIEALQSGAVGSLVFGVVSTGKYLAPSIVASFGRAHPDIRVKLVVGNRGEIIRGIERNDFDVVLMGRPPAHVAVESAFLCDHPHVLIAAPGHRLAADTDILAEDLLREKFLAREPGSGTRILMERFLDRIGGSRPVDIIEMGTNETIKQSVMAGLGVALISAHTCIAEIEDGRLAPLSVVGLPLVRQWFLLHRNDRNLSAAASVFNAYVLEHRQTLVPRVAGSARVG